MYSASIYNTGDTWSCMFRDGGKTITCYLGPRLSENLIHHAEKWLDGKDIRWREKSKLRDEPDDDELVDITNIGTVVAKDDTHLHVVFRNTNEEFKISLFDKGIADCSKSILVEDTVQIKWLQIGSDVNTREFCECKRLNSRLTKSEQAYMKVLTFIALHQNSDNIASAVVDKITEVYGEEHKLPFCRLYGKHEPSQSNWQSTAVETPAHFAAKKAALAKAVKIYTDEGKVLPVK